VVWLLAGAAMLGRTATCQNKDDTDDMERLKRQAREYRGASLVPDRPLLTEPRQWEAELAPDGSWKDVDYNDKSRGFWKTGAHLRRTLAMATLHADEKAAGTPDQALEAATLLAAHYWIVHDFRNPNWWQNEIGIPGDMASILLLMENEMSPEDKAAGLKIVERATISMTGQNLVWKAGIVFRRALLEGDAALARQARDTILSELKVSAAEGLQADWSFHQHGPQQQMGNYGLAFATNMVAWADIWRGTPLAMPEEKMALLRGYLLHGEAVVTVNGTMDISSCGRQLFPNLPAEKGRTVLGLLGAMAGVDTAHAPEYRAAALQDSQPVGSGTGAPLGTMNWDAFRSDMMVHRRPGFYASVKLCSRRVIGGENTNEENLKGRYLADGATFLYETSREYADIFPVWDWRRAPGVTCMTTGTTLAPAKETETDFAGGVSDGTCGAAGLDYRRDGVTGRKGWFFLDEGVVCLGAGIAQSTINPILPIPPTSGIEAPAVRTSVDQRLAQGETMTSAGVLGAGVRLCKRVAWVLHGTRGYVFAKPRDVWAGTQEQTGSWKEVYSSGSDERIATQVFSIWLEDAAEPGRYAYTLVPGATARSLRAYVANPPVEILSNTPGTQAVRDKAAGIAEVIFYEPGKLEAEGLTISVDKPCAVIVRPGAVYVADPTQLAPAVMVTINGKAISVTLPQRTMAGSTVWASGG
jgi:chondroitin AC lyase